MKKIPNYTEWSKSALLDACMKYGLSCSGTKADLINRLYPHTIEKRIVTYKERKARRFSQDLNGVSLIDEVRQLEAAMKKAAVEQRTVTMEYLEKRSAEAVKTCEKDEQMATAFCEEETVSITRQVRAGRERQVARTPSSSRVKKTLQRSAALRRAMTSNQPLTSAPGILTPSSNSRQNAAPAQPSPQAPEIPKPASIPHQSIRPLSRIVHKNSLGIICAKPRSNKDARK